MVSETESSPPLIGPRISLSDGGDFICISPAMCKELEKETVKGSLKVADFEFLSENLSTEKMVTADELFSEGKLLPFWQAKHSEKLKNITLKTTNKEEEEEEVMKKKKKKDFENHNNENRVTWFIDEDPSPRPPKCTVLWKELLRLKKQRNTSSSSSSSTKTVSSLSPSSSTSSSSSIEEAAKRTTRSTSMKIRPMIHVPICTPSSKSSVSLPPLFPISLKKNRVVKRTSSKV